MPSFAFTPAGKLIFIHFFQIANRPGPCNESMSWRTSLAVADWHKDRFRLSDYRETEIKSVSE
jgi:hypothetical protein